MRIRCILLLLFLLASGVIALAQTDLPNIIVVISDDQGYGDLSCHGNPWLKTPYLDQLYAESTRLTDFHVSPTCAPTRAALMTGHYANRTGVWHTIAGRSLLRESEVTMADVLAANGYTTGIFGKWHLGDNHPFRPQDRGFQHVLVHGGGGVGQSPDYWNNDYFDDTYFRDGIPEQQTGYCTDVWFDNALTFMDEQQQNHQPFLCYLSTNAPHSPYHVANDYQQPYQGDDRIPNAAFAGMIANLDENVGRLLDYLRSNRLDENTLLLFMTDNGTSAGIDFGDTTTVGFNAGMRGKKGSMYEGGHRVPCFIRWPQGGIARGRDISDLTAHVDILPTLIDLLDLSIDENINFDGVSLAPVLLGKQAHLDIRTLITDSQRLEQPVKWRQSSTMRGPWRLINGKELYHVADDPGQDSDVATQYPDTVALLRTDYEAWWESIRPVFAEAPAIAICPPEEPITVLRSHDMHTDEGYEMVPWNQQQVREGYRSQGWYAVQVPEAGTYFWEVMRWPPEVDTTLLAGLPVEPAPPNTTAEATAKGQALPLQRVGLSIDGEGLTLPVSDTLRQGGIFRMAVTTGHHRVRAWLEDERGQRLAAYYVRIRKEAL